MGTRQDPGRPGRREWDSSKIQNLICGFVRSGRMSPEAVRDAIAECVDCGEGASKCEKEKEQVRSLVRALDFASDALDLSNKVISAIGVMANAVALVARFAPMARPAGNLLMATHREILLVQGQVRAALEYAKLMARLQGKTVPRELQHLIPA